MGVIDIREVKGVFTAGDQEDIPAEYLSVLQNIRPLNGKAVKTFGYGVKVNLDIPLDADGLVSFVHPGLTIDGGFLTLAAAISNGILYVFAYSGAVWATIGTWGATVSGQIYQRDGRNPVIVNAEIMRFLPGNVGNVTASWAIIAASAANDTLTVAGNQTAHLSPGDIVTVAGNATAGNNGPTVVETVTWSSPNTVIKVTGNLAGDDGGGTVFTFKASGGLWLGRIERSYFDGLYTPAAGFYGYPCRVEAPSLNVSLAELNGGDFNADGTGETAAYRFSALYDGDQESLLTADPVIWSFDQTSTMKMTFDIVKANHNLRQTGIRVYRALNGGTYRRIHTLDFLRESGQVKGDTSGAYTGHDRLHIPALTSETLDAADAYMVLLGQSYPLTQVDGPLDAFVIAGDVRADFSGVTTVTSQGCSNAGNNGTFTINVVELVGGNTWVRVIGGLDEEDPVFLGTLFRGDLYNVANPQSAGTGSGHEILDLDSSGPINADLWDVRWEFWERSGASSAIARGSAGCFCGSRAMIVSSDLVPHSAGGGVLLFGTASSPILDNSKRAVHVSAPLVNQNDLAWKVLTTSAGMWTVDNDTPGAGSVRYTFYDTRLTDGAEHPLWGEVSIEVHGRCARVIDERLWQGNVVLDPRGKAEVHEDGVTWSETGMLDVCPVSNFLRATDREGGPVIGIAEMYGNPVILKRQAIITIGAKGRTAPFPVIESAHNIGCLAEHGWIEAAGDLFVPWHDGIYRLSPNNLAESDSTPTTKLRVTDQIEDGYQALSLAQKAAIQAGYDPDLGEIHWLLGSAVWAYSVADGEWRQISSAVTPGMFSRDENGRLMVYRASDRKVYGTGTKESATVTLKTKTFRISHIRDEVVREFWVTYKSETALTLKAYVNGSGTAAKTVTLPAKAAGGTHAGRLGVRARTLVLEITGPAGTTDVEINRIMAHYDSKER